MTGEHEMTARVVAAAPENRPSGRPVFGTIDTMHDGEITLVTHRGNQLDIVTNAETRYRVGRNRDASLSDFATGDRVLAFGTREVGSETLLATHLMKRE